MGREPLFDIYDRLLEGKLTQLILDLRAQGMSVVGVRDELRDHHKIDVDPRTVSGWVRQVEAAEVTA